MPTNVFKPITNPRTGETFRCLSSTPEAYVMEWIVQPGGFAALEHVHLHQIEVFKVEEGELTLEIEGQTSTTKAGDQITVLKGQRHIPRNASSSLLRCTVEYRPGLDMLRFEQCFLGLTLDGYLDRTGSVIVPMMGYCIARGRFQSAARPTSIPAPAFGLGLIAFSVMGAVQGWGALFERYVG
jgi:mannose-6-phosphate isomerase-like protein (cupin superfamily)